MTILATTKIMCPNEPSKRHAVSLHEDGSTTCSCADGRERGVSYAGRLLLGMPSIKNARGCAVLVAMVEAAESLLTITNSADVPDYGPWSDAIYAYRQNPVYLAALERAARAHPERAQTKKLVLEGIERAGYRHKLGKRRFREGFRAIWDVPAPSMSNLIVSAFDDDTWRVPYMPGWKEEIADKGLAVIGDRFVCGRSPEDASVFYAITTWVLLPGGRFEIDAHTVRPHKLVGKGKRAKLALILE